MSAENSDLLRYHRQVLLPHVGEAGQYALLDSHALIVGLGGLGCPAAMYLAAAGVGELTLIDFDRVDLSNLQRQIAHTQDRVGQFKVDSAAKTLGALNSDVQINTITTALDSEALTGLVGKADIVLDCTDNFATRFLLNEVAHHTKTPLVSGAAIRWDGQLIVFNHQHTESACYRCLYDESGMEESCSQQGVISPLVGIIGSFQALEAIKLLAGVNIDTRSRLHLFDGLHSQWREIRVNKDPHCPVCSEPQ